MGWTNTTTGWAGWGIFFGWRAGTGRKGVRFCVLTAPVPRKGNDGADLDFDNGVGSDGGFREFDEDEVGSEDATRERTMRTRLF